MFNIYISRPNRIKKLCLPWWLSGKESACSAGDPGSAPGSGRSPGGGHGNALEYSCLENSMDRGAWQATVHRFPQSWTQLKRLSSCVPIIKSNNHQPLLSHSNYYFFHK